MQQTYQKLFPHDAASAACFSLLKREQTGCVWFDPVDVKELIRGKIVKIRSGLV